MVFAQFLGVTRARYLVTFWLFLCQFLCWNGKNCKVGFCGVYERLLGQSKVVFLCLAIVLAKSRQIV